MGLNALLVRLSSQADTPDTLCNPIEVSAKPAWIEACTLDTPDTPQIIKCCENATSDNWLVHFTDRESQQATFTVAVDHAGALAIYSDAVAAEPIADMPGNPFSSFQPEIAVDRSSPAKACPDCRHFARPGKSDGYCGGRDDLPLAYGANHPLRRLPADRGASCGR